MKLTQLRDFAAVAELGGLRRAARHLGVAQPGITRSIRELEHELGASLFERRATGMVLTPVGEAFLRRSVAAQQELERARDEVRQLKGFATGTVSVGMSTAPHVSMLPRALKSFRKRFPDVRLRLIEGLFPSLEPGLRDGSIDFYVGPLGEEGKTEEFIVEQLFENFRVVVSRPGHPLAKATRLADLVDAHWVATSVTSSSEAELNPVFDAYNLPHPAIAVQAQTALTMIIVASSTDLLAMLPEQWLEFVNRTQLLTKIQLVETLVAPPICIVHRARLPLTPVAEKFADLLRLAALNRREMSSSV